MTRLLQFRNPQGHRAVALTEDDGVAHCVRGCKSVYDLAQAAIRSGHTLADLARARRTRAVVDLDAAEEEARLLPPIDHPDPAHCWVTGTGLTHLGSAEARQQMHEKLKGNEASLTDSMKIFKWGVEGGKPADGGVGVQPEWFFKGNGASLIEPGQPLALPAFAMDGGEEPEIAGVYLIGEDGTPWRLGYALGNEFSDHAMERQNYLYLAHSKLRSCSIGPELLLGSLPPDLHGTSRILRAGQVLWEKPFISGEANMSHSLENLERHHFKYSLFRHPGDVHIHFFGTSTLSSQDGVVPKPGDVFEISAPIFGRPLRNPLQRVDEPAPPVCPL